MCEDQGALTHSEGQHVLRHRSLMELHDECVFMLTSSCDLDSLALGSALSTWHSPGHLLLYVLKLSSFPFRHTLASVVPALGFSLLLRMKSHEEENPGLLPVHGFTQTCSLIGSSRH